MTFPVLDVNSASDACRDDSVEVLEYPDGSSYPTVRGVLCSRTPEGNRAYRTDRNHVIINFRGDGTRRNDGDGFVARIAAIVQGKNTIAINCL